MILKAEDIHTYYGDSYILQGVTIEVRQGEVLGIIGRNGMGKTTLIRSIIGFNPPRRGRVLFKDREISTSRRSRSSGRGMGIVPQGREDLPLSLTVRGNLTVGVQGKGGRLDAGAGLRPVSPAERARCTTRETGSAAASSRCWPIGRGLMTNPDLLLMDEPTEGLSPLYVETVGKVIRSCRTGRHSILLVEQNLRFASGTRIICTSSMPGGSSILQNRRS